MCRKPLQIFVIKVMFVYCRVLDRVDTSEDITLFVVLCLLTRILLALGSTGVNNAAFVFIIKYFPDNIATMFVSINIPIEFFQLFPNASDIPKIFVSVCQCGFLLLEVRVLIELRELINTF